MALAKIDRGNKDGMAVLLAALKGDKGPQRSGNWAAYWMPMVVP